MPRRSLASGMELMVEVLVPACAGASFGLVKFLPRGMCLATGQNSLLSLPFRRKLFEVKFVCIL